MDDLTNILCQTIWKFLFLKRHHFLNLIGVEMSAQLLVAYNLNAREYQHTKNAFNFGKIHSLTQDSFSEIETISKPNPKSRDKI